MAKVFKKTQVLKLRGKTAVFIDWANVYGWEKSLKKPINLMTLFKYLKSYSEISDINLYFGKDTHPKSQQFLKEAQKIGFTVITKPVKYILEATIEGQKIHRRKCDFDMEIALDCFESFVKFTGFIFFSGDGDFATLYQRLIERKKQVIVVYAPKHIGREIWEIHQGLFKINIENLGLEKIVPPVSRGA